MRRQIKIEKRNPKSNTISSYWCEWGTGRMPQHRLMFEYANGAIEIAKSVTATRRVAKKLFKAYAKSMKTRSWIPSQQFL